MKRTIGVLFACIAAFSVYAQISKGTKQTGGAITFFQDKSSNDFLVGASDFSAIASRSENTEVSFLPRIGYFISDNISLGVGIGFVQNNFDSELTSQDGSFSLSTERKSSEVEFEIFSRFHIPTSSGLYFFLEPALEFGYGSADTEGDAQAEEDIASFSVGTNQGVLYMVSDKVGIEASFGFLGYERTTNTLTDPSSSPEPENTQERFGLDLSSQTLRIGCQFYF